MQGPDKLRRENEALRDRTSRLSATILRISEILDVSTVLQEAVECACAPTGARSAAIMTADEAGQVQEHSLAETSAAGATSLTRPRTPGIRHRFARSS